MIISEFETISVDMNEKVMCSSRAHDFTYHDMSDRDLEDQRYCKVYSVIRKYLVVLRDASIWSWTTGTECVVLSVEHYRHLATDNMIKHHRLQCELSGIYGPRSMDYSVNYLESMVQGLSSVRIDHSPLLLMRGY